MTDAEIVKLKAAAEAELNEGQDMMLVSPLAVIGIVDRLFRCEEQRRAAAAYDQLT